MKTIAAIFVLSLLGFTTFGARADITPPPLPLSEAERTMYFPSEAHMDAMRAHVARSAVLEGEKTHGPVWTIRVGIRNQPGIVVYFTHMDDWILEEWDVYWDAFGDESGFLIASWRFVGGYITLHRFYTSPVDFSVMENVDSHHPLWEEAARMSKKAWKLLCEAYPCE